MRRILIVLLVLVACLALGIPNVSAGGRGDHRKGGHGGGDHRKGSHSSDFRREKHHGDSHRGGFYRSGGSQYRHYDNDRRGNGSRSWNWNRYNDRRGNGSRGNNFRGWNWNRDNRGYYRHGRNSVGLFIARVVFGLFVPRYYSQPAYGYGDYQQVPVYDRWGNFIGYQPRQVWGSYQYQRPYWRQY